MIETTCCVHIPLMRVGLVSLCHHAQLVRHPLAQPEAHVREIRAEVVSLEVGDESSRLETCSPAYVVHAHFQPPSRSATQCPLAGRGYQLIHLSFLVSLPVRHQIVRTYLRMSSLPPFLPVLLLVLLSAVASLALLLSTALLPAPGFRNVVRTVRRLRSLLSSALYPVCLIAALVTSTAAALTTAAAIAQLLPPVHTDAHLVLSLRSACLARPVALPAPRPARHRLARLPALAHRRLCRLSPPIPRVDAAEPAALHALPAVRARQRVRRHVRLTCPPLLCVHDASPHWPLPCKPPYTPLSLEQK